MNSSTMCIYRTIPLLNCLIIYSILLVCSCKENVTTISVPAPPRLRENAPAYFEVPMGEKVKLRCSVSGHPKPFVEWFKNNTKESIYLSSISDRVKITKNSLTIENVSNTDTDVYYCKASNEYGTIWKNFSVKAIDRELLDEPQADDSVVRSRAHIGEAGEKFPPYLNHETKLQRLVARIAGSPVTLRCPAAGKPEPKMKMTITWRKNGEPLDAFSRDLNLNIRKYSLSIDHLVESDSGKYECIVSNDFTHKSIKFTYVLDVQERVPHKPIFEDGYPSNFTTYNGGSARFECRFISDLQPRFRWLRHYNTSDDTEAPIIEALEDPDEADPHVLVINNVTFDDAGWYSCLAGNALGLSYKSAYLTVLPKNPRENVLAVSVTQDSQTSPYLVALIATCLISFTVVFAVILLKYTRFGRGRNKGDRGKSERAPVTITKKVVLEKVNDSNSIVPFVKIDVCGESLTTYVFPYDAKYEFPRDRLILKNILGEGAFGTVYKAEAFGLNGAEGSVTVAVKMLKDAHNDAEMAFFVTELEFMKSIGRHINIISLEGCCTKDGPLYIIMEYACKGNLRDFLRLHRGPTHHLGEEGSGYQYVFANGSNKNLTLKQLLSFAHQISRGMDFLVSKKCVHRDLAARNVLLTANDVVKIADFGLARDIHSCDYYKKISRTRLPIKWMAPEALRDRKFSAESDVWAYGVLLWEIMTLGSTPYPTIPCIDLYQYLKDGHRLPKPEHCPMDIYLLMLDCCHENPQDRPTFSEIMKILDRILLETLCVESAYLELDFPVIDTPENSSSGEED